VRRILAGLVILSAVSASDAAAQGDCRDLSGPEAEAADEVRVMADPPSNPSRLVEVGEGGTDLAGRRISFENAPEELAIVQPYGTGSMIQPGGPGRPPGGAGAGPDAGDTPPDTLREAAAQAWEAGETDEAMRLYDQVLADTPTDPLALHRTALMLAWEERYEASLARFDRLIEGAPDHLGARVDRARVLAWSGDVPAALVALDRVLERDPAYAPALEARALFRAWEGRYEESLAAYDDLLSIAPDNVDARRQRAQVLTWASDFGASIAVYDSILVREPDDLEARRARARALAFSDRLEDAVAEYEHVLERAPNDPEALVGLGRTLGWAGRLVEGERMLRTATREEGGAEAWVALGQNLRWQGRNAAALAALERAVTADPTDGDAREQLRSLRSAMAPSAWPSLAFESDSDGNRMRTVSVGASWHVSPRFRIRSDLYEKALDQNPLSRSTFGVTISGAYVLEPGWTVSAGLGGTRVDGAGASTELSAQAGLATPGRHPYGATFQVGTSQLDATAALAAAGVRISEASLAMRWRSSTAWRLDGSVGYARFEGSESNTRTNGSLSAARTLPLGLALGAAARAFTFEKDLGDGYFDPDFYGILELIGRWQAGAGAWNLLVEGAPGVQKVTRDGDAAGTVRASARIGYAVASGREIALSGGYSSAGLQSFATGASDYRYSAVIFSVGWRF
jgi:tetratricopeptide (TPR) repeat protein